MPKLRRLTGKELITLLQKLGFVIITSKGSHFKLRRIVNGKTQTLTIPMHGQNATPIGTLRAIYRQLAEYIPEDQLREMFYGE